MLDPKIPDGRLASTQLCHNKDGATFHDMMIINSATPYMPEGILVNVDENLCTYVYLQETMFCNQRSE